MAGNEVEEENRGAGNEQSEMRNFIEEMSN